MAQEDAGRRRRWLVIGLAVTAFFSMTGAWFLLPGLPDVEEQLTPDPADVSPPPLPPPDDDVQDGDSDDSDGASGGLSEDTGASWTDPDGLDTDLLAGPRTGDGWPLRFPDPTWGLDSAILPSEGRITALALSGEELIATVTSDEGSVLQVLLPDVPERRIVRLEGVPEPGLVTARARSPVPASDGWHLLAEDATGRSRIWRLDLATLEASPVEGPPGSRLDHLAGDGTALGVVVDRQAVWLRDRTTWTQRELGLQPVEALAVHAPATALLQRSGQIVRLDRRYTIGQRVGDGREPAATPPFQAWSQAGRVRMFVGETLYELSPLVALPGPDIVAGGGAVAWLRPDGRVGTALVDDAGRLRFEAVSIPITDITAVAVDGRAIAVAGRDGAVQQVSVVR